jgi:hypothetical protein
VQVGTESCLIVVTSQEIAPSDANITYQIARQVITPLGCVESRNNVATKTLKQPFVGKGHMPEGALTCTLWAEPTLWEAVGSSAHSHAGRLSVCDEPNRTTFDYKYHAKSVACRHDRGCDSDTSGAKADRREVVEVGLGAEGTGGRVLAESLRAPVKRHCGAVGGRWSAVGGGVESSRNGVSGR